MPETLRDRVANRLALSFPRRRIDVALERPIVSFTFDDVPETALTNGARIVEAHGGRATFYVAGGVAGQTLDGQKMLSTDDYATLARRGHEIAHHTFSHRKPVELGREYLADVELNDAYLASFATDPVRNFAFPYGLTSRRAQRLLGERFRSSRGVHGGINRGRIDQDYLGSVEIRGHSQLAEMTAWVDDVVATPGWLIFFTHDVSDHPSEYGCPPELLDGLVAYAVAAGCALLTVDAALDRIGVAR